MLGCMTFKVAELLGPNKVRDMDAEKNLGLGKDVRLAGMCVLVLEL